MARVAQWEQQIARRLRLRDLFVFMTVVDCGSMAQAAARLAVSAPAVSEAIANFEHALGVRLLDRTSKGVLPTPYGRALLQRGRAAFDELHQGIKDIESMSDPGVGEVRIGCPESIAAGFLLTVVERLASRYPRVRFHVEQVHNPTVVFPELLARKVDLVLARLVTPLSDGRLSEELNAEVLFDDPFSIVVGGDSRWARRDSVDLSDLVNERWIMTPLDALGGSFVAEAFRARGLTIPEFSATTFSIHMRNNLVSGGRFITALPASVLRISGSRYGLSALPIRLTDKPSPVAVVTLRKRTLASVVQLFVEAAREVASLFHGPILDRSPAPTRNGWEPSGV